MILLCMKFIKLFAFCYWKKFLCKGSHFSTFLFRTKLFYRIILHRHIVMCIWYHVRVWNQIWTLPHKLNVCKFIFHENVWCLDKTVRCTEQYWLWGYHFHGKVLVSCVRRYKRLQCDLQPGQWKHFYRYLSKMKSFMKILVGKYTKGVLMSDRRLNREFIIWQVKFRQVSF